MLMVCIRHFHGLSKNQGIYHKIERISNNLNVFFVDKNWFYLKANSLKLNRKKEKIVSCF